MDQPTSRRAFLLALGAGALGLTAGGHGTGPWISPGIPEVRDRRTALGAPVTIAARHRDRGRARAAVDAAFRALDEVERTMSLYRPDSQLVRLNRDGALDDPHPDLVALLGAARMVAAQTAGAFDVTVGPLWRLGRRATAAELAVVDWRAVSVRDDRIRLPAGAAITLNGIAQGYAADRARAALSDHGVTDAWIDAGELAPLGDGWTAGVQHPDRPDAWIARLRLDGRAVATSGDYATRDHIVDPRSGRRARGRRSVTVLAPSAWLADALSTALMVGGDVAAICARFPGTDALWVEQRDPGVVVRATAGVRRAV